MSIKIEIICDTAKEAIWELQNLANALAASAPAVDWGTLQPSVVAVNDTLDVAVSSVSAVDSADTEQQNGDASSVASEVAPAPGKRGRGRPRKSEAQAPAAAPAEPAATDEAQSNDAVPPPAPSNPEDEVKAVVARLTEIFQNGDPATREKIVTWRDSVGLNYLKHMTPEHLPAAQALLEVLQ